MRLNLTGSARRRSKSVGTEMIAPLWPELLADAKIKQYRTDRVREADKNKKSDAPPNPLL
jgi:hypothetical protein